MSDTGGHAPLQDVGATDEVDVGKKKVGKETPKAKSAPKAKSTQKANASAKHTPKAKSTPKRKAKAKPSPKGNAKAKPGRKRKARSSAAASPENEEDENEEENNEKEGTPGPKKKPSKKTTLKDKISVWAGGVGAAEEAVSGEESEEPVSAEKLGLDSSWPTILTLCVRSLYFAIAAYIISNVCVLFSLRFDCAAQTLCLLNSKP